jgi:hypothetical protein
MEKIFKTACLSLVFFCLLGIGAKIEAGTITIPPCAFTPLDYQTCTLAHWYAYPYALSVSPYPNGPEFVAPLNLPNGVTIKKITIYFTDELGGDFTSIEVAFWRVKLSTGLHDYIADGDTANYGAASGRRSMVLSGSQLTNKIINNSSYAYSIRVSFGPECNGYVILHEIAITY